MVSCVSRNLIYEEKFINLFLFDKIKDKQKNFLIRTQGTLNQALDFDTM